MNPIHLSSFSCLLLLLVWFFPSCPAGWPGAAPRRFDCVWTGRPGLPAWASAPPLPFCFLFFSVRRWSRQVAGSSPSWRSLPVMTHTAPRGHGVAVHEHVSPAGLRAPPCRVRFPGSSVPFFLFFSSPLPAAGLVPFCAAGGRAPAFRPRRGAHPPPPLLPSFWWFGGVLWAVWLGVGLCAAWWLASFFGFGFVCCLWWLGVWGCVVWFLCCCCWSRRRVFRAPAFTPRLVRAS